MDTVTPPSNKEPSSNNPETAVDGERTRLSKYLRSLDWKQLLVKSNGWLKFILFWIITPAFISAILWAVLWLITRPFYWKRYKLPPLSWWVQWEVLLSILGLLPFLILFLWKIPQKSALRLVSKLDTNDFRGLESKDRIQLLKDIAKFEIDTRLALTQIIGGAIVLVGIYFTAENVRVAQKNLDVTQRNLINAQTTASENLLNARASLVTSQEKALDERFTEAAQQLGKSDQPKENNITLRLGAIQTLEQLAWQPYPPVKDDLAPEVPSILIKTEIGEVKAVLRRHAPVMKIIAAFIKETATYPKYEELSLIAKTRKINKIWPPADISAALDVIAHRMLTKRLGSTEVEYLDLSGTILIDTDLMGANLERALLFDAHLEGADLRGANLKEAVLNRAVFDGAHLEGADLRGATGVGWNYLIQVASIDDKTLPP